MEQLGGKLRETRQRLGLTLDEVERATRIRTHHLEAIERGDLDALPSAVQARGFIRNYADFLGLDPGAILLEYAGEVQSRGRQRRPTEKAQTPRPPRSFKLHFPRWLSSDVFFTASIVLVVAVILIWGASRLMSAMRAQNVAAQGGMLISSPTISPTATTTATPTLVPAEAQTSAAEVVVGDTPVPTLEPLAAPLTGINLRILVEKRAWVQITVDGKVQRAGQVVPGDILEYQANDVVEVATGNGGGLRVFLNGNDQGPLGDLGQVVDLLWTRNGPVTPTPTQSPTPTITPTPTRTLRPTITPRPTSTRRPTATLRP